MTWICTIPGASPAVSAIHATLELGLASFMVGAGGLFLLSALRAYRRVTPPADREPRASA